MVRHPVPLYGGTPPLVMLISRPDVGIQIVFLFEGVHPPLKPWQGEGGWVSGRFEVCPQRLRKRHTLALRIIYPRKTNQCQRIAEQASFFSRDRHEKISYDTPEPIEGGSVQSTTRSERGFLT